MLIKHSPHLFGLPLPTTTPLLGSLITERRTRWIRFRLEAWGEKGKELRKQGLDRSTEDGAKREDQYWIKVRKQARGIVIVLKEGNRVLIWLCQPDSLRLRLRLESQPVLTWVMLLVLLPQLVLPYFYSQNYHSFPVFLHFHVCLAQPKQPSHSYMCVLLFLFVAAKSPAPLLLT